ncbi:MAG: M2 family metallopeptidase [Bryobacteraceae bacterium]
MKSSNSAFGALLLAAGVFFLSCGKPKPTAADAKTFVEKAEARLLDLANESGRAGWIQATYITLDTESIAAKANERFITAAAEYAKGAKQFDGLDLPADVARKLNLLKVSLVLPALADPKESEELTQLVTRMEGVYGKGKYCPDGATEPSKCLDLEQITRIHASSRDPKQLLEVWKGWRTISPPIRGDYRRFVELSNKGAKELGFADTGAMWRAKYDMPPDDFARDVDRLWEQVKPLYTSLHAYTRLKLREKYGDSVPANGPIPAHLLGNPWAQSWDNVYDLLAPKNADPGFDLTQILKARKTDEKQMVRHGEGFFTSLGFAPLPNTFWDRSLFRRPQDREVVCHASAWDVDNDNDLRIKMCIDITGEEFAVVHHELGHNFYQRAYNKQPFLFRESANDGFHEAVGDTIALSITPEYLVKLGFLAKPTDPGKDTGLLLRRALEKVSFLPFGLLIDQWRWQVFSGQIPAEKYNQTWWDLVKKHQGVVPPVERTETDFDPGAKYHVPANVPYTRYFLAHILQFQFHKALAQKAGCTSPLHRCSIYDSKEAGKALETMLAMGLSKPWPDALEALTGKRQIDAGPMLEYFAPLQQWLNEQTAGKPTGW